MEDHSKDIYAYRLLEQANSYVKTLNCLITSRKLPRHDKENLEDSCHKQLCLNSERIRDIFTGLGLESKVEVMNKIYEISAETQTQAIYDNSPEVYDKLNQCKIVEQAYYRQLMGIFNQKMLCDKNPDEAQEILSTLPSNHIEGLLDNIQPWCSNNQETPTHFDQLTKIGNEILATRELNDFSDQVTFTTEDEQL